MTPGRADLPLVILGAGLAGLSLGCALLEVGVKREIVLVDRRREWARDRTWCTWDVAPGARFTELADHRWPAWRIRSAGGEAVHRCPRMPYLHLRGDVVYDRALDRLTRAPHVTLLADEPVDHVVDGDVPRVVTARRRLEAAEVFDGRGVGAIMPREVAARTVTLFQRFLGWEVETDAPVFDPATATLMDFRGSAPGDLRFLYVLPFCRHRALVEDTSFGTVTIPAAERRAMLAHDLAERLGAGRWSVRHEERGTVPMSTRPIALHPGRHVHAIGTAGGAVRPSSGYAFSRIQSHVGAIAAALAAGHPLPRRIGSRRRAALDAVFLSALADRPERFEELFLALGRRVDPAAFARFMADASTPADEARVIAALLTPGFLGAAARSQAGGVRARGRRPAADRTCTNT